MPMILRKFNTMQYIESNRLVIWKEQVLINSKELKKTKKKYVSRRTCKRLGVVFVQINLHNLIPRQAFLQDLPDQITHDEVMVSGFEPIPNWWILMFKAEVALLLFLTKLLHQIIEDSV